MRWFSSFHFCKPDLLIFISLYGTGMVTVIPIREGLKNGSTQRFMSVWQGKNRSCG
ncbi:hypothetical protein HORM4_1010005 [Vibrio harveyi]|nr:hypothetical protein HORM4_1010005 [Vibrio harveyi]